LAASGVAAVVWSDWSSFKIEAYDATTYNARILTEAGVLTSLHSDDSQLASRMNWEAAKLLRTGMNEEQALALVTLNPAKILGLDQRIGSLEPGKDADFVIWSGSPLSSSTIAQQTWVDGRKYFDLDEDRALRREVERERAQLIQAALQEEEGGEGR
jgi:imidazolonepropionase-like amidohydrolase